MTESNALEVLKKPTEHIRAEDDDCIFSSAYARALETAMDALEEVQQYRALEEKLSGITVKEVVEHFIKTVENQTEEEYTKGRILTNKEAEEWEQIKAIGTVSEFQELKGEYNVRKN